MKGLREYWNSEKLDKSESFLKDYLLNKRYLDDYVPTYDEVVHDSDGGLSEDEENVRKQEEFEHKFNFRFEEPDADFIKRYPRTIKDSMRQKDEKRKLKRKEVEERKEKEKQQKKEELKMLKAMKRNEIMEKLEKLRKITGNEDMDFKDEDIEADFDPEEHDRRMQKVFEEYDNVGNPDEEKPTFSDLDDDFGEEDDVEDWDNWTGPTEDNNDYEPNWEDDDFNMDCDHEQKSNEKEIIESTKGRKKSRRKSKFAEAVEETQGKPVFDPNDKTFEEYVDEYYKLDCEDIIGDLPCRFKYRKVEPNDFGLSCDEILSAKDGELNAWASLRKACQYRSEEEEKRDVHVFRNKGKNVNLKKKILPSLFENEEEEQEGEKVVKKKRNKKKKGKEVAVKTEEKSVAGVSGVKRKNEEEVASEAKKAKTEVSGVSEGQKKRRKKKKKQNGPGAGPVSAICLQGVSAFYSKGQGGKNAGGKNNKSANKNWSKGPKKDEVPFSDDRLKAYGMNPNQFKRKLKKEKYKKLE